VPEADRAPALTHARTYGLIRSTSAMLLELVPDVDVNGIRLRDRAQKSAQSAANEKSSGTETKTYGASERRALDRLIEATGDGKDRSQ
jgi:hypothetical protein